MNISRIAFAGSAILLVSAAAAAPGDTNVVSTNPAAPKGSHDPVISGNGRYVLYFADIAGKPIGSLYLKDLQTNTVEEITVSSSQVSGGRALVGEVGLSDNGKLVVFASSANNLVPNDTNVGFVDVFLRNRTAKTTARFEDGADAQNEISQFPYISGDGKVITYTSSSDCAFRISSGDPPLGSCINETDGFGASSGPLSYNNDYIVFGATAALAADDTNGLADIYVLNRTTSKVERMSVNADGSQNLGLAAFAHISGNGRFVIFRSDSSMGIAADTNGEEDLFIRDRQQGTTQLVSVDRNGGAAGISGEGSINGDGRYVAFASGSANVVTNDTNGVFDVFVRDRIAGTTVRASVASNGTQANGASSKPSIDADGTSVVFQSVAQNLPGQAHDHAYIRELNGPAERIMLLSYSLAFSAQVHNTHSGVKRVSVRNVSDAAAPITGIKLVGSGASQFSTTTTCGASLAAAGACSVEVTFAPTSVGAKSAVLNVNGGGSGLRTVAINGTGK